HDVVAEANETLFDELASHWHMDTEFSSVTRQITSHDDYRQIIAMGWSAVPWILRDLADRGGDWFTALEEITHEQPVSEGDFGYPRRMKDAWLKWGRANRYIS